MKTFIKLNKSSYHEPLARELSELDEEFLQFSWTTKDWLTLNLDHYKVFVFYSNGQAPACGMALYRAIPGDYESHLLKILVTPEFRGKKIAHGLMDFAHHELSSLGIKRVYLEVQENNSRAIRFYEKHAFKRMGLSQKYYTNGDNAVHMETSLTGNI